MKNKVIPTLVAAMLLEMNLSGFVGGVHAQTEEKNVSNELTNNITNEAVATETKANNENQIEGVFEGNVPTEINAENDKAISKTATSVGDSTTNGWTDFSNAKVELKKD